jgi:hypothetical protein
MASGEPFIQDTKRLLTDGLRVLSKRYPAYWLFMKRDTYAVLSYFYLAMAG